MVTNDVQGQDIAVPGHSLPAPPARRRPQRRTVRVELTLKPEEALLLRAAWKASGVATLSSFVAKLVGSQGDIAAVVAQRDELVDVSRLAAAAAAAPAGVRRLHADLLRLGGLVKSLFLRAESAERARSLSAECATTLQALMRAAHRTEAELLLLQDQLAPVRREFKKAAERLAR